MQAFSRVNGRKASACRFLVGRKIPRLNPRQTVEIIKLEYTRGRGIFDGANKWLDIGKKTNGESIMLGRH